MGLPDRGDSAQPALVESRGCSGHRGGRRRMPTMCGRVCVRKSSYGKRPTPTCVWTSDPHQGPGPSAVMGEKQLPEVVSIQPVGEGGEQWLCTHVSPGETQAHDHTREAGKAGSQVAVPGAWCPSCRDVSAAPLSPHRQEVLVWPLGRGFLPFPVPVLPTVAVTDKAGLSTRV